jgi:hypothetical protein
MPLHVIADLDGVDADVLRLSGELRQRPGVGHAG